MVNIDELDDHHIYAALLRDMGSIVGSLIFPTDRTSKETLGGFRITHPRTEPTIKRGNLHLFTLDVGIGVYEILIPLSQIVGLYRLGPTEESIIESPDDGLWKELGPRRTWNIPFGRMLVNETTKLIEDRKFKFRPVVELPKTHSFPHPVSFPRYAPFRPRHSHVVYLDHEVMHRYFRHFEDERALVRIFNDHPVITLSQVPGSEVGKLLFIEGAIGFFDPPQTVTWRGESAELVAITSKPFSESELGEDWILGCVRNICFPFFRESIERLAFNYYMCGEWREIGPFMSEYGNRRCALFLGAGICFDKDNWLEEESIAPFEMVKYRPVGRAAAARIFGSREVIKILFLAANPSNATRLRLDQEIRAIDQALRQAEFRDRFDVRQHWAVRVTDLQGYLLRHKPDIVHFSGHGSAGSIILEDDSGTSHSVSTRALSRLFSVIQDNVQCVVLNACYSEQQAKAIAEHIDCVVGMSKAIGDKAAISFTAAFYQALGFGRDVKTAFDLGCVQIDLESLNEQDTPKLIAIKANPEEIVFV